MRKAALLLLLGLVAVQAGGAATEARRYLPIAMRFLDRTHGFAELAPTTNCDSCRHRIQRTRDGGQTWQATLLGHLPLPIAERRFRATWRKGSRQDLVLAAVVDAKVAWATWHAGKGTTARLVVSQDGGRSWRKVKQPCVPAFAFYRPLVAAVSARHAWLLCLGQPGAGQQNKALYETLNGRTWILRRDLKGGGYGHSLAFLPSGFGLLAESRGGLLVTRDGGRKWGLARVTSPDVADPQAIGLFQPGLGLVLVRDDRSRRLIELYRTRDAGRKWSLLHVWR